MVAIISKVLDNDVDRDISTMLGPSKFGEESINTTPGRGQEPNDIHICHPFLRMSTKRKKGKEN